MDQKYNGFEFIQPLITDMVQEDPVKRPTMDEVVTRFSEIQDKFSTWKLRSRMVRNNEIWPVAAWRALNHWRRTMGYVLTRKGVTPNQNDNYSQPFGVLRFFPSLYFLLGSYCVTFGHGSRL